MSNHTPAEEHVGYYVRKSANPRAVRPWQVRHNLPDQTYHVTDYCLTQEDANDMADLRNACDETGADQPLRYG